MKPFDSYGTQRPESSLVLPSLKARHERDSSVRQSHHSVFKQRSASTTEGLKHKSHAKMHTKIRKQSVEVARDPANRAGAGTGSIDDAPSIQIVESAEPAAAKASISSPRQPKPAGSRSPRVPP